MFFQSALDFPTHFVPLFIGHADKLLGADFTNHMFLDGSFDAQVY